MTKLESLENRRLFAGGIDPSFGSSTGAIFDAPGVGPTTLAQTLDPAGRMVFAGSTRTGPNGTRQMFISRVNNAGQPDTSFGGLGTGSNIGTPRGIAQISKIVAAPDESGYYALGQLGTAGATFWRLVKFDTRGRVDTSFGKNGVVSLEGFDALAIVVQSDSKPIVVLRGEGRGDEEGRGEQFYAVRYSANGVMDLSYDTLQRTDRTNEPNGYALLTQGGDSDGSGVESVTLNSATIDPGGRLLAAFDRRRDYDSTGESDFFTFLTRLSGNGRVDSRFTGGNLNAVDASNIGETRRAAVAIGRPDGQIAVLFDGTGPEVEEVEVMLAGSRGQLSTRNAPKVTLSSLVPGFVRRLASEGSIVVTPDSKLIVGGTVVSGSVRTPTLLRLNADLSLDTSFGTNGTITLPGGGAVEAGRISVNADGTLFSAVLPNTAASPRVADVPVARVFQDDRPVVSYRGARLVGGQIRLAVSIRGVRDIDVSTVGSDDLRLIQPIDRAKGRLLSTADAGNGDIVATYSFARGPGTYLLTTLAGAIEDENDNGVRGTIFGTVQV